MCSSAYRVALEHIQQTHPIARRNNYVFHFSDGDDWAEDHSRCKTFIAQLLEQTSMVGHGEIRFGVLHINVNGDGSLALEHERSDLGALDLKYAEKTLEYLYELWKKPVHLETFNGDDETTTLMHTASGMEVGK
jgi:spore cortex formation protein SpoVR/YcgB (stage V sporulation)